MFSGRNEWVRTLSAVVLTIMFAIPVNLIGQTAHVVSPADLQKQAITATQARQQNIEKVRSFLSGPVAEEALQKNHINPTEVKKGVSSLSDQELAQLAARADRAQHDFAAGYLSTMDVALIILAVAVLILIIVIAK
jgi:hypothetical protein